MSICTFWQLYDSIVQLILKETFQFSNFTTGIVMSADNVLALFLLPLFGTLSDKVDTKWGKRTPFIVFGTIAAVATMMLIPIADNTRNFTLFAISLGFILIFMGTYRSPAVALMPDLTPKPLRSKANAVINLMGAVGGILALAFIKVLVKKEDKPNYFNVFLAVAIVMILAVVILIMTIKEKKMAVNEPDAKPEEKEEKSSSAMAPEVKRSLIFMLISVALWFMAYNAVTSAFSRYAKAVWNLQGGDFTTPLLIASAGAIVSYIPIGIISSSIGRKKTILGGVALLALMFGCGVIFNASNYNTGINLLGTVRVEWIYILFALVGVAWAAINVNSYPMVVEMSKGSDVGKYTGYYYTFSMAAQVLTPILSGYLIDHMAISYRILFPYATIFAVLAAFTMMFVKHGDSKPPKKASKLENFDVAD
jgi:MFS family permease